MALRRGNGMDYAEIIALRHAWAPVVFDGPKWITGPIHAWLSDYPGWYDLTTEPHPDPMRTTYRFWFSDDNTAFAFKMRWA